MAEQKPGREGRADKAKRGRRNAHTDDGSGLVEQKLSPEELKERGEELISWLVKDGATKDKKKQAVAKFNAELKLSGERIKVLTLEIDTGCAYVDPQMDLPGTETGNDAEAEAS